MVDVYVALIILEERTIETVPAQLRNDVADKLEMLGLDGRGRPIK